jgi:hypothetical protein
LIAVDAEENRNNKSIEQRKSLLFRTTTEGCRIVFQKIEAAASELFFGWIRMVFTMLRARFCVHDIVSQVHWLWTVWYREGPHGSHQLVAVFKSGMSFKQLMARMFIGMSKQLMYACLDVTCWKNIVR